jgi:hypothetical protein
MTDLIRRLEEAKEGSRELDCLLAPLLGWYRLTPSVCKQYAIGSRSQGGWIAPKDLHNGKFIGFDSLHGTTVYRDPPKFTRDLQDAVSAVPEGYSLVLHGPWQDGKPDGWKAQVAPSVREAWKDDVTGATAPLALCIAILRAMEAKNE